MKNRLIPVITAALLSFLAVLSGCGPLGLTGDNTDTDDGYVHVSGTIGSAVTWSNDKVYCIDSLTTVTARLTIEPGTVVRFRENAGLGTEEAGSIIAE